MRMLPLLVCAATLAAALSSCGGSDDPAAAPVATTTPVTPAAPVVAVPVPVDPKFTVAVIGDSPYGIAFGDTAQYDANPAFIKSVNADTSLSLAIHVGDIHSGKEYCTESFNIGVFNQWKGFTLPLVYVPGDNEWSDCHKAKEGGGTYGTPTAGVINYVTGGSYAGGDPIANLGLIRSIFFPAPGKSQGAAMPVHSQALEYDASHPADAQFVEHVWFEKNGVMFVTVNIPGGSNNNNDIWYGTPTISNAQKVEVANRSAAALRWLDVAFAAAKTNKDVGLVIQLQADMWDQDGASKAHLSEYKQFVDRIAAKTLDLAKPVLLINGDSHNYRSDNPLVPGAPCVVEKPATAVVGAALVPATAAVSCSDASVASVATTYHADTVAPGPVATDPYLNQPGGYNVPNFHRLVAHTNPANPMEYLRLTVNPNANADNGADAFGPFSWVRVKP